MGFMESTCRRPENTAAPSSWQHNWVAATFGAPSSQSLKKHCHHLNPTQCLPRFSQIAHPWAQVHIPKLKHIRWRKVIPLAHGTIVDTLTGRMMNKVKFFFWSARSISIYDLRPLALPCYSKDYGKIWETKTCLNGQDKVQENQFKQRWKTTRLYTWYRTIKKRHWYTNDFCEEIW